MALSNSARRFKDTYANLDFWELHAVQQVIIEDYEKARDKGHMHAAGHILEDVNAIGEVLDERDGTK